MKELSLLVWLSQLGLSVAVPPALLILLAKWLRDSCGWGDWVMWAGVLLGIILAIDGLRTSIKAIERLSRSKKSEEPPAVSFNDHA